MPELLKKAFSFEENMTMLEAIIEKLEQGNVPLNDLLSSYQEGAALVRSMREALTQAEASLKILEEGVVRKAELPDEV